MLLVDLDEAEVDVDTLEAVFERWNATPDEDLAGLSPGSLAELLEDPFEATDVLVFADVLARPPVAPVCTLLAPLFEALLPGPVPATARGYLPPPLCAAIAADAYARHATLPFDTPVAIGSSAIGSSAVGSSAIDWNAAVRSEARFRSLHVARQTAIAAGLVRRQRGHFDLTRRGRRLYVRHGMAGVYPALLRGFATRIEWAALDRQPRLPILQASVGFSLLLLARFGGVARPATFYAERWLRAFPGIDEVFGWEAPRQRAGRGRSEDPTVRFAQCYRSRVLERCMVYFGLAELRGGPRSASAHVRATPLLHDLLALRLGG